MKVVDLQGNSSNWKIRGHIDCKTNPSDLHTQVKNLIHKVFPMYQVLEEVPIHPKPKDTLYLDFYLPTRKLCIEAHGEQHYKFVPHFHSTKMGFILHQKRDKNKISWCEINNIDIIVLAYNESIDTWENKLKQQTTD